jgi:uncharacterized protein YpmS
MLKLQQSSYTVREAQISLPYLEKSEEKIRLAFEIISDISSFIRSRNIREDKSVLNSSNGVDESEGSITEASEQLSNLIASFERLFLKKRET